MVLILGLLGCLAAHAPLSAESPVAVTTMITLSNPEAGEPITPAGDVMTTIAAGLMARGWSLQSVADSSGFQTLSTHQRRTRWMMEQAETPLSVLIEVETRPRSQLGGRYQWVVNATITVVGPHGDTLLHHVRLPTTLPHIHLGENDALHAVARRLATHTATQIERYQKGGE